jgi:hypothetical protein
MAGMGDGATKMSEGGVGLQVFVKQVKDPAVWAGALVLAVGFGALRLLPESSWDHPVLPASIIGGIFVLAGLTFFLADRRSSLGKLGITAIHERRDNARPAADASEWRSHQIQLLGVYPFAFDGTFDVYHRSLARRDGPKIKVLMADPSAPFLAGMSSVTGPFRHGATEAGVEALKTELAKLMHSYSGRLEVRLYKDTPSWSIYIFDDVLFAAPYLLGREASDGFCIEAKRPGAVYDHFFRHYHEVWSRASPLAPARGPAKDASAA